MNKNTPQSNDKPLIENDILRSFVENQRLELSLNKERIELQKKQIEYSHLYALKALDVQKQDRNEERQNSLKVQRNLFFIIGVVLFLLLAFGVLCLWLNKDEILKELIKIIGYSVIPSVGSYFYGLYKGKNKTSEDIYHQEEVE